jgi:poly(3-hydroxybutyrate) depolymerase
MWAHGLAGTGLELEVDNHPLPALLIPLGYAWAASSYSRNDYDICNGVHDTHVLVSRFNALVGKPSRVFMTGASMGGHITVVSIEQYPNTYDAALPICGALADYELFDYFLDFNAVRSRSVSGLRSSRSTRFPICSVRSRRSKRTFLPCSVAGPLS